MKHLKKLSAVLMLTALFSVTFTSCIDNEVSDAVDQVYLAQAEFLQAQAALKDAEAQYALARAASEAANAQYTLATAAVQQSYADEQAAITAGIIEGNSYTASVHANGLTLAAAQLQTNLEIAAGALAAAQSANAVAMVTLSNAVAAAKNTLLTSLYGDYTTRIAALNVLEDGKLVKLSQIATQQLYLAASTTESMAFAQAQLVANLAALEAGLANAQAEIVRLEGLSASTAEQDVTDLQAEKADLSDSRDSLGVVLASKENMVTVTKAAWIAAGNEYSAVTNKENEISILEGVIDAHNSDIDDAQAAIDKANANILALPAANLALAAVDTTTAYNAIQAQIALIGTDAFPLYTTGPMPTPYWWPTGEETPIAAPVTLNELWLNAAIAEEAAQKALDDANFYWNSQPPYSYSHHIQQLEDDWTAAVQAIEDYNPAITVAMRQSAVVTANLEEVNATQAWETNPIGDTWYPGPDGVQGNNTDALVSYMVVVTNGTWPAPNVTTIVTSVTPPAGTVRTLAEVRDNGLVTTGDVAIAGDWYNVEADDYSWTNLYRLNEARWQAGYAQYLLDIAIGGLASVTDAAAIALDELKAGYLAIGYDFDDTVYGTVNLSDYYAIEAYIVTLSDAYDDANIAENAAQADISDAYAELGTDFRPAADANSWTTLYSQWWAMANTGTLVTGAYTSSTYYEQLQIQVGPSTYARAYDLPHTGTGVTLYEALRNAYFTRVWAQEAVDALGTVTYTAITTDLGNTNAKTITEATADIAYINTLLPSHIAALAQLNAELVVLEAAAGGLDELLFDPNDHWFTYNVDGTNYNDLGYIPLLVDYLNAIVARNEVEAAMVANVAEQALIQNTIDHIYLYLLGDGTTPVVGNVASFEIWRTAAINAQKDLINGTGMLDGYLKDINQAQVSIDKGLISKADAVLLLAEMQRELTIINAEIGIQADAAESILARINVLIN